MAKKIQPVWAIDIGQAALKALKLVPGDEPDMLFAEAFDFIEYPKILSQPDADAEELVREALATFLDRNDVKGCKVALAVSGQAGLVKFIKLPPVEKKRIPDIVKFEARQQSPFALEEVIWQYQQIGGDEDEGEDDGFTLAEVGLFAMKKEQINRAILPLKNAGIELDIVQMGPIALYNFANVDRKLPKGEESGSVVYVDIGADNSDLIITDGQRIWQRNVPIGGNHFTRALTKELKLTFAKAEHLKRNATKAPDPRAVFTAMRGVFNDFSSEINRSIGFYSSVNRTAKITKVVGLGNGFKLPGLQKFLQQNLSYEVEKLESFERLTGPEVVTAPQFVENLPSFAIAYGLAAQGLGRAPMKTNLIPPEIEQVRMIRRKKPWALAASTLFMLGFTVLFLSYWNSWAKATNTEFATAVNAAKTAADNGDRLKTDFDASKSKFDAELARGKSLVDDSADAIDYAALLQLISSALPAPARELKKDADDPKNFDFLSRLKVHIDGVFPVYRTDLESGWFNDVDAVPEAAKNYMHAYDRTNAPKGSGWVVQVTGHHYNPDKNSTKYTAEENRYNEGPTRYLKFTVLPRFWTERLRAAGIHHATITWVGIDRKWTSDKTRNMGALAVLLQPEAGKGAASTTSSTSGDPGLGGMGGGSSRSAGMAGQSMGGGGMGMGMEGMMSGLSPGGAGGAAKKAPDFKTLTRTDFVLTFLWQPPAGDAKPPTPEEIAAIGKLLDEAVKANEGAIARFDENEEALSRASEEKSFKELQKEKDKSAAAPAPPADTKGGSPAAKN